MRLFQTGSLLILIILLIACSEDNSEKFKAAEVIVKTPIQSVSGEYCSISEDDLFSLKGKKVFGECELRQNPEIFDGKILRIKTNYGFMIHGNFLSDDGKCEGVTNSIHEAISVWFQLRKDHEYIHKTNEYPVAIVAVGRFSLKKPAHESDTIYDNTSFVFDIMCLEKAERIRN